MAQRAYIGLLALVVVLAGCTGAPIGPTETAATTDNGEGTDKPTTMDGGQVNFYISDEQNAIGDFEHLNVTVTKVGFHRGGENGSWIERDVNNTTVDLTELQGENATLVDEFDLPNGTYTKVFIYVGEADGTLSDGSAANVKLPSGKLQLNKQFVLGNGSEVNFVFDVTVVKAGNSGKYVLKPVVGESGTDVPMKKVGEEDEAEDEDESENESDDEARADALNATFVGDVTRGENATVRVTRDGEPVENATVYVNDEEVGTTDANGEFSIPVDENATELTVTVVDGDAEAELEVEFEDEESETETETESDDESNESADETATATP